MFCYDALLKLESFAALRLTYRPWQASDPRGRRCQLPAAIIEDHHFTAMASSAPPTANWEAVADTFYRKVQLYTALWDADFDLNDYFVRGAPYGGALGTFDPYSGLRSAGF